LGLSKAHIPARPTANESGIARRLTQINADTEWNSSSSAPVCVNLRANAFLHGLITVHQWKQCTVMSVWAELPDGGEFPNGEVYGADSLKCWVSRNWFGVVGSGDFAHYLAGTRVERLRTIKGAFAYAGKRYMAKKEEMPVMEQKPGRYWGVIGREHLPLGTGEAREAPFTLPGQPRTRVLDRMNRIYRISNGVRKESHRHPGHPVNPVKIPLRFISVIVWRTRHRRNGNICGRANCGRKILRPSCFAPSSFGLNVRQN
jgi:hypothetical protein